MMIHQICFVGFYGPNANIELGKTQLSSKLLTSP